MLFFFKTLPPFFVPGGRERKKHTATVLGSGMSGRNHLLPCTFQKLILTARMTITMRGTQPSRHQLQRPNPARLARRHSLVLHAPPPRLPGQVGAVRCAWASPRAPHPWQRPAPKQRDTCVQAGIWVCFGGRPSVEAPQSSGGKRHRFLGRGVLPSQVGVPAPPDPASLLCL